MLTKVLHDKLISKERDSRPTEVDLKRSTLTVNCFGNGDLQGLALTLKLGEMNDLGALRPNELDIYVPWTNALKTNEYYQTTQSMFTYSQFDININCIT